MAPSLLCQWWNVTSTVLKYEFNILSLHFIFYVTLYLYSPTQSFRIHFFTPFLFSKNNVCINPNSVGSARNALSQSRKQGCLSVLMKNDLFGDTLFSQDSQTLMILYNMMHCCSWNYPTAYKVVSSTLNVYIHKCNKHINACQCCNSNSKPSYVTLKNCQGPFFFIILHFCQ